MSRLWTRSGHRYEVGDFPGPRLRRKGTALHSHRPEGQSGSYIPHGEGSGRNNPWPEDTLPQPRCEDCKDRIFYENGIWWHAELVLDKDHAAVPETFA